MAKVMIARRPKPVVNQLMAILGSLVLMLGLFLPAGTAYAAEPDTTITVAPSATSYDYTPTFEFTSDEEGPVTFECRLDGGPYTACTSPYTTAALAIGAHVFEVRATNATPETDQTPATHSWEVANPTQIDSCAELLDVDNDLAAHYELTQDLDCTANGNSAMVGDNQTPFTGEFDGQGHTITIDLDNDVNGMALFSQVTSGGQILDVTVAGSVVGEGQTGGLVGGTADASFTNVHSTATVEGTNGVGGLIGEVNSGVSITDASSSGDVTGDVNTGGLAGSITSSSVATSTSSSTIHGYDSTGGFVGTAVAAEFTNTSATGEVNGENYVGGFAGGTYCASIHSNSYASGNVYATGEDVGGYAGSDGCEGPGTTYNQAYALGNVEGGSDVGGFLGQAMASTLNQTYASGSVTANGDIGGLVGDVQYNSVIEESVAFGNVNGGAGYSGGLIGYIEHGSATVYNSFARGNIEANHQAGGFIGYAADSTIIGKNYSTGNVQVGTAPLGGFVAVMSDDGNVSESFWDEDTSGTNSSAAGINKTTSAMKDIDTFTTELGEGAWDFENVWSITSDINEGYPCLQWLGEDCAFVPEAGESDDTDYNGDNIPDSEQPQVGSYISSISGKRVVLDMGEGCELTADDVERESNMDVQDVAYDYPHGLFEFAADCEEGSTTTVSFYYYDVSPEGFIARKYNPITDSYSTLDGASITSTTIDGHLVTVLSYDITDGGELDMDGEVNGQIEDPVGIASLVVGAPATGLGGRYH